MFEHVGELIHLEFSSVVQQKAGVRQEVLDFFSREVVSVVVEELSVLELLQICHTQVVHLLSPAALLEVSP
jgi:hypothetical protein